MARDLGEAIQILQENGINFVQVILDTHSDTMLRFGALLDEFLEIAIKTHWVKAGKAVNEKTFQQRGKLEMLGDKIKKAQALGLLDDAAFADADVLREIRNAFAHLRTRVHFDSPEIEAWAQKLSTFAPGEPNQGAIQNAMTKVYDCIKASLAKH